MIEPAGVLVTVLLLVLCRVLHIPFAAAAIAGLAFGATSVINIGGLQVNVPLVMSLVFIAWLANLAPITWPRFCIFVRLV